MILSIGNATTSKIGKSVIDKKSFKVSENKISNFIKGSEVEYSTLEFNYVYYVYFNDYSYSKVSKEYFDSIKIK
jgi:hypothetical protein